MTIRSKGWSEQEGPEEDRNPKKPGWEGKKVVSRSPRLFCLPPVPETCGGPATDPSHSGAHAQGGAAGWELLISMDLAGGMGVSLWVGQTGPTLSLPSASSGPVFGLFPGW